MIARRLLLVALALSGLACSQTPTLVSSHDFDRPTDMTFGCMGLYPIKTGDETQLRPTGLPMSICHPPPTPTTTREPDPEKANIARRTFGFVTNSARGELSVIDMDRSRLVDLDLAVAGFNPAPLGQLPEAAAISDDGCRLVTANRGSCDLTLVNPGLMMAAAAGRIAPPDAGAPEPLVAPVSQTVTVRTGSGKRLAIAPYEVRFLPQDTSSLRDAVAEATASQDFEKIPYCPLDVPTAPPQGWAKGAQTGWKALVTFPACDLVALVDLPSGDIVDSVKVKVLTSGTTQSLALEHTGTEPTCPIECGDGAGTVPVPPADAGSAPDGSDSAPAEGGVDAATDDGSDDGATDSDPDGATDGDPDGASDGDPDSDAAVVPPPPPPPPTIVTLGKGVGPLAVRPEGKIAFVGLANAPLVAALAIEPNSGLLSAFDNNTGIFLNEGAVGSARLRLSVDPYSEPQVLHGDFQDREYLYVIARDGTVRVVHVKADARLQECETNIDPTVLPAGDKRLTEACIPVDAKNRLDRRLSAGGPGLAVSGARDVAVIEVRPPDYRKGQPSSESVLNGIFAMILTDSGAISLVNLDAVPRTIKRTVKGADVNTPIVIDDVETLPLANSLRDRNFVTYTSLLDPSTGPPRVDVPPVPLSFGPRLESVYAEDSNDNPLYSGRLATKTYVVFPDRGAVTPQTWSVSWEGDLIGVRFTGRVDRLDPARAVKNDVLPGMDFFLSDPGGGFCEADVHADDVVSLLGCADGNQCGSGQVCVRSAASPQSAAGLPINGLCLTPNAASQETLVKLTCRRLLESVRRYRVTRATGDGLELRPNLDELVAPTGDPNACKEGDEGKRCGPPDDVDSSHGKFVCHKFPSDNKLHCVNPCGEGADEGDADCRVGRKCVDFGAALGGRMCADAPDKVNLQDCFPQLTSYRVQAGHSFLVQGSATGIALPPVPVTEAGVCPDRDPDASSPLVMRIRMDAPACVSAKFPEGLRDDATLLKLNTALVPQDKSNPALALLKQRPAMDEVGANANPCLFVAGPNDGDSMAVMDAVADGGTTGAGDDAGAGGGADAGTDGPTDGGVAPPRKLVPGVHVRALFRNPQLQFILSNLEQQYTDVYQMRFDVHGGFLPQVVAPSASVEVGLPSRLLVSPLASPGVPGTDGKSSWKGPQYMFVVDQRRLGRNRVAGGATRGQVLRINVQHFNAVDITVPLLLYDDYNSSGGLYPIQ